MCGRFTHRYTWQQLHRLLSLTSPPAELPFRYNVAPMQKAPVVRMESGSMPGRSAAVLQWGLVPSWAENPSIGSSLINARAETAATKPAFLAAFRQRRCVVPVSGFYEWRGPKGSKGRQPFYISPTKGDDSSILCLAGLWERWQPRDGESLETFTIITTDANAWMRPLHDRMPVILAAGDVDAWLDPKMPVERAGGLLQPAPDGLLQRWPVSTRVNGTRLDDAVMIQPVADPEVDGGLFC